ncbi:4-(cytidine 5'-diphospho)-2-C-methyl-D-erythritol kinase [Micavibrio aeruginosavorus]|uniref:4-(cytidine 5'-diphospho)-2-C-methyl-D-erythritol kinase n=1 Tax=Micavibrio aeruginosavorus TaxID=349221 RepID=UPI003F4A93B4
MGPLSFFAPAKINLYLHITGRRDDGYHLLDSLVGFADIGDSITITPSDQFSLTIDGPFADAFTTADMDASPQSGNLIARAAWALARATRRDNPGASIHLSKNLPLASGIGGASSDAAATIRGLCQLWGIAPDADFIAPLALSLGADVPVCLRGSATFMRGIGDVVTPAPAIPSGMGIVLVNPLVACPTPSVFRTYTTNQSPFTAAPHGDPQWGNSDDFIATLRAARNDLTSAATATVPAIQTILDQLSATDGCALARLSGSGATCFGLFPSTSAAERAAATLKTRHTGWWAESGNIV